MKKMHRRRGFTIIELIVVIAIVGVLAAILVPTFMNVVTKARVLSVNKTAASIQKLMNQLLLQADSNYYGIVSGEVMTLNITVNESGGNVVWQCSAATAGSYDNNNQRGLTWGTAASYNRGDALDSMSGEEMICSMLSEEFDTLKQASMVVVMWQGYCTFVVFTTDTGGVLDAAEYPAVTNGRPPDTFEWDGRTAGISPVEKMVVGTAPIVDRAV